MSDYGAQVGQRRYYEMFLSNMTGGTVGVNVGITSGQSGATLASLPAALVTGGRYNIAATGIPASTTFINQGSTAITLSNAATATNAAASSTITVIVG